MKEEEPRHVISLILENESGALSRVAGLFSARGYNIESLTVAPTNDATVSRMTIVTSGSEEVVTQITKQLNKLVDVITLANLTAGSHVERELLLIKLTGSQSEKNTAKELAENYGGRLLDSSNDTYIIELTGTVSELDEFMSHLNSSVVLEVVRTGASGVGKGSEVLSY